MSTARQWTVSAAPPLGAVSSPPFEVGQLPGNVAQAIWRGTDIGQANQTVVATGFDSLDAQLPGGGWPCNSLTELLQPQPSLCEWRLLSPALARLVASGGQILLVGPPKRPHAPGLVKLGISEKNLVWIAADTPAERLWCTEQLVKANPRGGAILAWLPQVRAEQLRRLQVHAQSCDCPVFLFRPAAAQLDASPAPLRVLTTLGHDWALHVHILKRKGALLDGTIVLSSIPGTLASVLTPRLMHPSQLIAKTEASHVHVLGSAVTRQRRRQLAAH
ncbi:MAG: translesion DNA synthesis-associated protein ImuA [Rhodoferax sp.]|uniref:translesion DNA synthesis-associated protein ImuA n=1 Tax=Rhodoferax sp. TaxID=50421 RepID=UPI0017BE74F3|nr:translesion DNA synthesis-associated protein ImuA [Rhodoferax sp.]NMM12667.1 translesion DNA synthesis-associated protein ImuA [Rhodoferax sp.]NMM19242.1 translesion DNA synthesis-associated protein ImuA [Rhodoferax sp.]